MILDEASDLDQRGLKTRHLTPRKDVPFAGSEWCRKWYESNPQKTEFYAHE